jgi:hypothetical protein
MGMMPERLINPTVGLMPTSAFTPEGHTIDPSVSVPTPAAARFAAMAAPVPELDPQGLRSSTYGFLTWPPRPLQPLADFVDRKFAHSLRFVLPRSTAPAARSRPATNESRGAVDPCSASEPAVVIIRSPVSMLSLMSTGIPCNGPRTPAVRRSASSASAIESASGLSSITDRSAGPLLSMASIRAMYSSASRRAL